MPMLARRGKPLRVRRLCAPLAVCLLLGLGVARVCGITPAMQKRAAEYRLATLMATTAMDGEQLAEMSTGRVIMMDSLTSSARKQVLDAARLMIPMDYQNRIENMPSGCKMAFWVFPSFEVSYSGGPFGMAATVAPIYYLERSLSPVGGIYVAAFAGDWQPQGSVLTTRDIWLSAATADTYSKKAQRGQPMIRPLPNPPQLSEAVKGCGSEIAERAECLRVRAFEVLAPLGERWLSRVASVPFSYQDFASGRTAPLDSLTDKQREWVEAVYKAYAIRHTESPQWAASNKAQIRLSVVYRPTVTVVERMTNSSDALDLLQTPDVFSQGETGEWAKAGKPPLRFVAGDEPPVYMTADEKGIGWTLQ